MPATNVETLTNPRDSLPNVYTNVTAREVDFVTRFGDNWTALRNILGIMRPIRKAPGTSLVSYSASVALESGNVGPGEVIPYSKATIAQASKANLTIEKYAKAVPIEDVNAYGAEIAVEKSDDAFLTQLQNAVLTKFYTFLNTGTLAPAQGVTVATWQDALAKAQGLVLNKFADMQKDVTAVVGFANILDAYDYLGTADITIQTQFGLTYIKDFLGLGTVLLNSLVPKGKIYATAKENLVLYYVPANDADLNEAFSFTSDETGLIGIHEAPDYTNMTASDTVINGMKLLAEQLDGVVVASITGG